MQKKMNYKPFGTKNEYNIALMLTFCLYIVDARYAVHHKVSYDALI